MIKKAKTITMSGNITLKSFIADWNSMLDIIRLLNMMDLMQQCNHNIERILFLRKSKSCPWNS